MPVAPRMTPAERSVARDMHSRGLTPAQIAKHLGRNRSSITRLLAQVGQDPHRGRPSALSEVDIARAIRVLEEMVAKADGQYEVTTCIDLLIWMTPAERSVARLIGSLIYMQLNNEKPD